MPIVWLFVLYFIVKSSYWKKFFLYLSFVFLLTTSMPITSTYIGKFFYSDNYKISNNNKKPTYIFYRKHQFSNMFMNEPDFDDEFTGSPGFEYGQAFPSPDSKQRQVESELVVQFILFYCFQLIFVFI